MSPNATHLLVAAALLAAPVSLGVASQTDTLSTEALFAAESQQAQEAETIETFEGEVAEDVSAANLDLRIDHGTVKVLAWEKDAYKIEVLEANSNASLDQGQTETTFDETGEEDTITLSLTVDHQSLTGVQANAAGEQVGDSADRAIVAHVPQRLTYEKVYACEGETAATSNALEPVTGQEDSCVETTSPTLVHGEINLEQTREEGLNLSWGVEGLEGNLTQIEADNGPVDFQEIDFTKVDVETDNGAVTGEAITAETFVAETDNGAIELVGDIEVLDARTDNGGVDVDSPILSEGAVETDNGAVELNIEPTRSGQLDVRTDNGAIEIWLGHADDVGYTVEGASDNGDVQIALADEQSDDEPAEPEAEDEHDYSHGAEESARTSGYEELPIQMELTAESDNGGIQVVEETASLDQEQQDEESSSSLAALAR